ncbi:BTAD domain-containing putative transcriptional regulator [Kitasatospora albolonga]|uniref:BTAD domain-containing putative transcriptional regulator n=1 Tax=Kitasatospora albolonga TaxID=68173 RepID=UPI0031ED53AD
MRYGVLGPLAVWDADGAVVPVPEAKVRTLLAVLLVHGGRAVPTDRLVDALWGDALPGNPANALQAKVSQLRRAIGRDRVTHQPAGYRLELAEGELDAGAFRTRTAGARLMVDPGERSAALGAALELWRGEPYADFGDEEFARAAVQRLAEERLSAEEERAEARLAAGDPLLVGGLAELVDRHPLRERLRAVQLRALYRAGRQGEALAAYGELRALLAEELGIDPGPELTALHAAILRQDPALLPAPAELGGGAAVPTGVGAAVLPVPRTGLVGRGPALERLLRLVRGERLVTLTGPGGVGKTRLALALAHRLSEDPREDVRLVELGPLPVGTADLAQPVAAALGVQQAAMPLAPDSAAASLAAALRGRRTLLVLDNCEHVIDAAAALVAELLAVAPGLRVLATSRESLRLPEETLHPVTPLEPADAARLFTERAAAAAPGFGASPQDTRTREAVELICGRLDGLPLALELAATRVRSMGVRELADRLGDRFRLLASGQRGLPARQQTLRAVIDWSWDLLTESERAVLRRLSVPVAGCTLAAAEAVCAADGTPEWEVLDLVGRLVDRSLVDAVHGADGPRYHLLESVAAYARERLHEAGELGPTADRHARHYADLAVRAEPALRGPHQREWLARLDADAANLHAALHRADPSGAARQAAALAPWWLLRGRLHEARTTLATVLDRLPPGAPGEVELRLQYGAFAMLTGHQKPGGEGPVGVTPDPGRHGRALWLHGYGLHHAGDPVTAREVAGRALELCEAADDAWGTAAARALLAVTALVAGDLEAAGRDGRAAALAFRQLGDGWGELQTVPVLAALAEIAGDHTAAATLQTEGLAFAEGLGLAAEVSARLGGLGRLALLAGDWDRARELHERARQAAVAQGYLYGEVFALMGLALGARRAGELDEAERHLRTMLDDYPSSLAGKHLLHVELGFIAELRGQAAEAADLHRQGLSYARELGDQRAVALSLEGLAGAAVLAADPAEAARLLAEADALRRANGGPLPPAERGDVDRITAAVTS